MGYRKQGGKKKGGIEEQRDEKEGGCYLNQGLLYMKSQRLNFVKQYIEKYER